MKWAISKTSILCEQIIEKKNYARFTIPYCFPVYVYSGKRQSIMKQAVAVAVAVAVASQNYQNIFVSFRQYFIPISENYCYFFQA